MSSKTASSIHLLPFIASSPVITAPSKTIDMELPVEVGNTAQTLASRFICNLHSLLSLEATSAGVMWVNDREFKFCDRGAVVHALNFTRSSTLSDELRNFNFQHRLEDDEKIYSHRDGLFMRGNVELAKTIQRRVWNRKKKSKTRAMKYRSSSRVRSKSRISYSSSSSSVVSRSEDSDNSRKPAAAISRRRRERGALSPFRQSQRLRTGPIKNEFDDSGDSSSADIPATCSARLRASKTAAIKGEEGENDSAETKRRTQKRKADSEVDIPVVRSALVGGKPRAARSLINQNTQDNTFTWRQMTVAREKSFEGGQIMGMEAATPIGRGLRVRNPNIPPTSTLVPVKAETFKAASTVPKKIAPRFSQPPQRSSQPMLFSYQFPDKTTPESSRPASFSMEDESPLPFQVSAEEGDDDNIEKTDTQLQVADALVALSTPVKATNPFYTPTKATVEDEHYAMSLLEESQRSLQEEVQLQQEATEMTYTLLQKQVAGRVLNTPEKMYWQTSLARYGKSVVSPQTQWSPLPRRFK